MRVHLIRIGNSRGIRIPKALLDQLGPDTGFDLELRDGRLVITPVRAVREQWEEAFRDMAARGDDRLLDGEQPGASSWDDEEWEW